MAAPCTPTAIPGYRFWAHSFSPASQGFHQHRKTWYRLKDVDLTPSGYRAEWELMFRTARGWAKRINVYTHATVCHDPDLQFGEQAAAGRNMSESKETYFVSRDGTITPASHVRRAA
jgi:hypothetical protein